MIDLTIGIPNRGYLEFGTDYNRELLRDSDFLVVERKNVGAQEPWFTKYEKKRFLCVSYWSFVGWYSSFQKITKMKGESLFI